MEYITNILYLLVTKKGTGRKVLTYIYKELYIINNLRVKILIKNNIIGPKKIIINIIR